MSPASTTAAPRSVERVRQSLPSRRRFLQGAGAAGLGGALVLNLGAERREPAGRTTITYAVARRSPTADDLEPRTRTVPDDWYEELQRAFSVREALRAADLPSLVGAFAVPGSYDEPSASIAVDATDEGIGGPLQELSGDLAVDLRVIDELPTVRPNAPAVEESLQVDDLDRRDVPSGVACTAGGATGTVAPALFEAETGDRFFGTSNHLYGEAGTKELEHADEGLDLLHGDVTRRIGRVVRGYPLADVVRVRPVAGYHPVPAIAEASIGAVVGQYTREGLADLMARGEELQKVGAFSRHTAGPIKGVDGVTCYVGKICKPGQLKWGDERTMADGDSGSVTYHPDPEAPDEQVLVAGVNNARTWWPGMDFTWGPAAHHLLDEYGLHF